MICETCHGQHYVDYWVELRGSGLEHPHYVLSWKPCPDCGGHGVSHCCDGLCEQPDSDSILYQSPTRAVDSLKNWLVDK